MSFSRQSEFEAPKGRAPAQGRQKGRPTVDLWGGDLIKHMRQLRTLVKEAINQRYIPAENYPYANYKMRSMTRLPRIFTSIAWCSWIVKAS